MMLSRLLNTDDAWEEQESTVLGDMCSSRQHFSTGWFGFAIKRSDVEWSLVLFDEPSCFVTPDHYNFGRSHFVQ
jgi:hypothetical protein